MVSLGLPTTEGDAKAGERRVSELVKCSGVREREEKEERDFVIERKERICRRKGKKSLNAQCVSL